jgi:hypothetical protein
VKVLFDHNVDRRFRRHLVGHEIKTTREMGWETLANGILLRESASAGFDVFISIDKKLRHEQNLITLPLPIVVLDAISNALPSLIPFAPGLLQLLSARLDRCLYILDDAGTVSRLGGPLAP